MRERRNDIVLAVVLSLVLHLVPLAILLFAALHLPSDAASAGSPMQADMVDLKALSASARSALARAPTPPVAPAPEPPPPPPEPAPLPEALPEEQTEQQPLPQEMLPTPDQQEQEEVREDANSAESAPQEQAAKHRQGQVDLTTAQHQDRLQQDDNEMQRQRRQQLEDIRRQRESAQRDAALAEARLQQLADARARNASASSASNASPPPGNGGQSRNLLGAYQVALQQAIRSNWTRPDNVPMSEICKIVIRQIPNGAGGAQVVSAQVDPSCPYDEVGRRSVEAAVLKAQPLPYQGFESVFARTLTLNFRAQDP